MAQLATAQQVPANVRAGLNSTHAQSAMGFVHNDGPEWSNADPPVEQVLTGSSPTTPTQAVTVIKAAKIFLNTHMGLADTVNGDHIYAHNVADGGNTITSNMDDWSVIEANISEACRLLINDECAKYEAHRANSGGTFHTTVDTVNILGVPTALASGATPQQLVERANHLASLVSDHVVKEGGTHSAADGSNVITAAFATYDATAGADWDKLIALINEIRTKLIAHVGAGAHAAADAVNVVSVAAVALPAGWNTLVGEIGTDFPLHCASVTCHNFADTDNPTTFSVPVTSVALMIVAAQQIHSKVNAHVRAAPKSRAFRLTA